MMSELEKLTGQDGVTVKIGVEELTIRPLRVGQLPAFLRAVGPVFEAFATLDIEALMVQHSDRLIECCAIATDRPRAWVEDLEIDTFLELVTALIEVNRDFFVRRVAPAIEALIEKYAPALSSSPAGPTDSPS